MKLYFLRHGIAEEYSASGRDSDRRLTPEGIAGMEAEARTLSAMNLRLDRIVTSPYPRAKETAEIVARALGIESKVEVDSRLQPGARLRGLQEIVEENPADRIMVVGHNPDFSMMPALLTGCPAFELKKGGIIRVDCLRIEPGAASLEWFIPPSVLIRG